MRLALVEKPRGAGGRPKFEQGLHSHAWGITPAKEEEMQKHFHMFLIWWEEKQLKQL